MVLPSHIKVGLTARTKEAFAAQYALKLFVVIYLQRKSAFRIISIIAMFTLAESSGS